MEITGISNIFSTGATTASVWVRVGGAQTPPNITTANGWVEVIQGATITGANNTALVAIPFGSNVINIPANTPVGIHIAGQTRYQTGTAADQVVFSDGTFTVNVSDSVAYGGGLPSPTFNPRRFLGSVTYALGISGGCANLFSNFSVDSIGTDSAQVNWTPGSGNTGYRMEYGVQGFTPGTGIVLTGSYPASNPPVNISGLTPDTDYDIYFTEYCGTDSVFFPAPQNFRTLPICPAPSDVTILALDSVSITFTYTATTDSLNWEWGPGGFVQGTGTTGTSVGDTVTISGLSPNTNYDLSLTSDCSDRGDGLSRATTINFTTDCGFGVARFTENFDGTDFPCLRAYTDVTAGTPTVTITTAFNPTSAPQQALLNNSSASGPGQDVIMVFQPFFGMGALNKMIEFNAKTSSTLPTTLDVVSFPNPDSLGNYNVIQTITLNGSNQRFTINLDAASNYNGTDVAIGLRHGAQNTFQAIYFDDFVYDVIPTCPPINPFLVESNAAGSDVFLRWQGTGSAQGANVAYGSPGFTPNASSNIVTTPDTFATVTGLNANTLYDFYIQDSCGTGDLSVWVGPFSVLTGCSAPTATTLPWFEGFESFTTGPTFNGTTNLCAGDYSWRFDASDATASRLRLQAGTTFYRSGSQAATLDHSPSAPAVQSNFLTLTVNLTSYTTAGGIELSFYVMSHGQESSPDNRVWVRGAPSDPWIEVVDLDAIRTSNGVYDSIINLDIKGLIDNAGQSIGALTQVRFGQSGRFGASSINFSDGFTFDDISLRQVACPEPAGLAVSALSDTSATLNWTSSASNFQYWFGPAGFYQGTTSTGGIKIFAGASGISIDTLMEQSCYEFLVRAVCGPGDTSLWSGPFSFCTFCSPVSAPYYVDWDNLTSPGPDVGCFSSIEDPSFATTNFSGVRIQSSTFYNPPTASNYVEIDNSNRTTSPLMLISPLTTDLTAGDKRIRFQARSISTANLSSLVVGSMSDASDASTFSPIDTITAADLDPTQFTQHIINLTPANGYNGTDQFFVLAHGQNDPFDVILVDELHYEVIPTCPEVSNLSVLAVDTMNATVAFTPFSGSSGSFQIEYGGGIFGNATHTRTIVSNDTVILTGLSPNFDYCFWVREICAPGDTSNWTGPVCFKTFCQAISAPYFDNFDALSAQSKDLGCFSSIEASQFATSNFLGVTVQNSTFTGAFSAPNFIEFDNSSNTTDPLIMVSPITRDLTAGDKRVRFQAKKNSLLSTSNLVVGTMSNPLDASTFSPLDTLSLDVNYLEFIVNLDAANGYNGTDRFFALAHDIDGTFDYLYVDDLHYEQIPGCVRPDSLLVSNITQNSAFVSWQGVNGNSPANYQLEYGLNPFGDPSNTRLIQSQDTLGLNGLTAGTGYCVWVREICAPGDTSLWQGPVCFSTPCPTSYAAPYSTNFEGISIGIATGTPAGWENCWTTSGSGPRWESEDASGANENSLNTGPFYDNTFPSTVGGTYMYLETSTGAGIAELVSPGIDIATISNPELEYHYHMFGATINKLVIYAEDASGTRTAIDSLIGAQQTAQADPFLRRNVSLSGLTAGVYKFVFEGHRGTSFTGDIAIDDVSVQVGASCPQPLSLSADGLSTNSALARWTTSGSPVSYQVEYGVPGFTLGTGTSLTSTADSLVITFAAANNLCQEIYVRSICTVGDTSAWFGPVAVCPEPVLCDSLDQYNNASSAAPIWDQSALFVEWAGNLGGDTEISTAQAASAPNSIRIHDKGTAGLSDIVALFDTISTGAWAISFDMYVPTGDGAYFNIQQNYIGGIAGNLWGGEVYFLDNGTAEVVYTTGSNLAGTFTYSQNQWINVTTVIDLDNDSIWVEYNGNSTGVGYQYSLANPGGPLQFNGVNFYSGVKAGSNYDCDYYFDNFCISPRATNSCAAPTNFAATANVGCDSVELDWNSNSGSSVLEYGPAGFTPGSGTSVAVSTTPHVVTGLNPGTTYDFHVADICGSDTSLFVTVSNTTASGPLPVASFTIDSAIVGSGYEVYVDASASTNATSYSWDFGNGLSSSAVVDTMIYLANGNYTITLVVSNGCGSDTATFTTNANIGLEDNPLARSLNVYPNPANDVVNLRMQLIDGSPVQVRLLDAQGRIVRQRVENASQLSYEEAIDVSDLARGIYHLEVSQGAYRSSRRITLK